MNYQAEINNAVNEMANSFEDIATFEELLNTQKELRQKTLLAKGMRLDIEVIDDVRNDLNQHVFRLLVEVTEA